MANLKITDLPELSLSGLSSDDVMPIVDITTDDTNKVTLNNLKNYITSGLSDVFTTGATYNNTAALATFTRNDGNTYTLDLSSIDVNDTFVTGGTFDDTTSTLTLSRNDGNSISVTGVTTPANRGNLIYIDSIYGDDLTGSLNNADKPFLTYSGASALASSGDLIVIRPGNYSEKIILKDGLKIYSYPNVVFSGNLDTFITDNNVAVSAEIYGYLNINCTNSGITTNAVYLQSTGTTLYMECGDIIINGNGSSRVLWNQSNQQVTIKGKTLKSFTSSSSETVRLQSTVTGNSTTIICDNIIGRSVCVYPLAASNANFNILNNIILEEPTSVNQCAVINNSSGDVYLKANKISTTTYRAINTDLVTADGNFYVDVNLIESTNSTLTGLNNIYGALITNYGSSANTYVKAKNMIADGGVIYLNISGGVGRKTVLEGNMYSKQNLLIRNSSTRKLIVKNSTLRRGGDTDNNIVVGMGNYIIGNIFAGIYNDLLAEFDNVKIIKDETLSGTSTNPIFGLDGNTSEVYVKNCEVYGENIFSGATAFNAGSLADGNVYFKNTTSSIDNGTNVTDTSIVSGFIYDTNFKIIE
jgi:hypothetical protein